jgi:predicted GIY-YIG superfamily endonuclease
MGILADAANEPQPARHTWGVYVIEIHGLANTLYVGQSGLPPTKRLKNHLRGYKANPVVHRQGGHLRWDLFKHIPRFDTWDESLTGEARLAEELRLKGFKVLGGH